MTSPLNSLLLEALSSNDHQKYARVISLLRTEAERVAMVNIPEDSLGAVDFAIEKVENWLSSAQPFTKSYPFAYAKKIVRYAVIDYIRLHKGGQLKEERDDETAPEHQTGFAALHLGNKPVGWEAEALTTQIDGLDYDPEKRKLTPWRVEKLKEKRVKPSTPEYPAENGLLVSLPDLNGWGHRTKEAQRIRWQGYSNLKELIKSISDKERPIIEYYLWNHRNSDIARELNIGSKKVENVIYKWIRNIWNWSDEQLRQAKLLLVTNYLAKAYERYLSQTSKSQEELYREELYWPFPSSLVDVEEKIRIIEEKTRIFKENIRISVGMRQIQDKILHQELISAPETKSYFERAILLERELLMVCGLCYKYWGLTETIYPKLDQPPLFLPTNALEEEDEEWEEQQDREYRTKQIAQLPIYKRKLYINNWRDQAGKLCEPEEALQRELNFLDELERTYCKTTENT